MPRLAFPEYKPDLPDNNFQVSKNIANVLPLANGYAPFQDLVPYTRALPAACRGYFYSRNTDGTVTIFAGTINRLYKLNATDLTWTDVSAGGLAYTNLNTTAQWQFAQYQNIVIAVQANAAPQAFTLGSSTIFAALGGSPPQAAFIAIINSFIVLSGLASFPIRLQWCDIANPVQWTAGVGQADFQDLADGGNVKTVAGFDLTGIVMQDAAIRMMTYAPGSPVVFQISKLSINDGIYAPYCMVIAQQLVFFISPQGFKRMSPGGFPTPIGKDRVDVTFFSNVDKSQTQLILAASDPEQNRVFFTFKSNAGSAGLFDTVYCYDWVLDRWTKISVMGEYLASLSVPGITLEGLDATAPGVITISATGAGATHGGLPSIRLTISGLTAGSGTGHTDLNIQNRVEPYGIVGTTEANGNWPFVIIDSTHIDVVGPTFANAWVSGGAIGGSVDQLTLSFDAISNSSLASLSMVNSSHIIGFFNGSNLEAQLETQEAGDTDGYRMAINGFRAICDASTFYGSLSMRDTPQSAYTYSTEQLVNDVGIVPQLVDTRYSRAKIRIPYATAWTNAIGVEPIFDRSGEY